MPRIAIVRAVPAAEAYTSKSLTLMLIETAGIPIRVVLFAPRLGEPAPVDCAVPPAFRRPSHGGPVVQPGIAIDPQQLDAVVEVLTQFASEELARDGAVEPIRRGLIRPPCRKGGVPVAR